MVASKIVCGTDGSGSARDAVQWAATEAALRGCDLELVHGWFLTATAADVTGMAVGPLQESGEAILKDAETAVAEVAPGVHVRTSLVATSPASALIDASRGAELLVVGSRGHGGFAGLVLGSVSNQVVHHAYCPVVVIRR